MVFLIRVFTLLNCIDCLKHLQTLQSYCDRTPANLQIIDVDKEENLPLIFEHKIEGIPHTICYDISGNIICSFEGIKTPEEFDLILYNIT